MTDFKQQFLSMLAASNSPAVIENTTQERIIPASDGSTIVSHNKEKRWRDK